jgi:RNA-splicing ligase RtcB
MAEGAVICRGKGKESFNYSAPHGAGRSGSRTWAYDKFDIDDFAQEIENIHNMNTKHKVLDEIPSAYKKSEDIIEYMSDTVEIQSRLRPILNMKGG